MVSRRVHDASVGLQIPNRFRQQRAATKHFVDCAGGEEATVLNKEKVPDGSLTRARESGLNRKLLLRHC